MIKEIKALIKAIELNTTSGQIDSNIKDGTEFCAVLPLQYIADELEELKEVLKNDN